MASPRLSSVLTSLTRLRRIVAIVAACAILLAGVLKVNQLRNVASRHRRMAQYCRNVEITYMRYGDQYFAELDAYEKKGAARDSLSLIVLSTPGQERAFAEEGAKLSHAVAARYQGLRRFYEKASRFPWI